MERVGIFPGSFDPFTLGHLSVIKKAAPLFDTFYVSVGINRSKPSGLFSYEKRIAHIHSCLGKIDNIKITTYTGLTISYCKEIGANFIVRGLRNSRDLYFEVPIAQTNAQLGGIETIFVACEPSFSHINSNIVRDIYNNHGDISLLVPGDISILSK